MLICRIRYEMTKKTQPNIKYTLTTTFMGVFLLSQTITPKPVMETDRKNKIGYIIASLSTRQFGNVIDRAAWRSYVDLVTQAYFRDTTYRKFVLGFNTHVLHRFNTLDHGSPCDPTSNLLYKHAENGSVSELSLQYWVNAHVPNKTGHTQVPSNVQYCNFRRGLICNPNSNLCECPRGATYGPSHNPAALRGNYCFLNPNEKCQLLDLKNTDKTKDFFKEHLPYLIFNPDRPLSCSKGTQCRFKGPYINTPRCWCMDFTTHPDCSNAKLIWPLPTENPVPVPIPPATAHPYFNIASLLQVIWDTTFGFEDTLIFQGNVSNRSPSHAMVITPDIKTYREELMAIDQLGDGVDIQKLENLKSLLIPAPPATPVCWEDLNPDYTCTPIETYVDGGANNVIVSKTCKCELRTESQIRIRDGNGRKRYGSICAVGVYDDDAVCDLDFVCHRWDDKESSDGVCYCPEGYGWPWSETEGVCGFHVSAGGYFSVDTFIHPKIVAARGEEFRDMQQRLSRITYYGFGQGVGSPCNLVDDTKWADFYRFLVSLTPQATLSDAVKLGLTAKAFYDKLRTIADLWDRPRQATKRLCDHSKGIECAQQSNGQFSCQNTTDQTKLDLMISKNVYVLGVKDKMEKLIEYTAIAEESKVFKDVEIVKEVDCEVSHASGRSSQDVDENKECLENNVCSEDYSSSDVLNAIFQVTNKTGSVITSRIVKKNGEVHTSSNSNEVVSLIDCERTTEALQTSCITLTDMVSKSGGGSGTSITAMNYKNCEKQYLEKKKDALVTSTVAASDLTSGSNCSLKAEYFVQNAVAGIENSVDLYQIIGNLRKALGLSTNFCDRSKLLTCIPYNDTDLETGKCECVSGTNFRYASDGVHSVYCYLITGPCKQDVSLFGPLLPPEKDFVLAHYGDMMKNGDLDAEGCVKNLCVKSGNKECLSDEVYTVFINNQNGRGFSSKQNATGAASPLIGAGLVSILNVCWTACLSIYFYIQL